MKIVRAGAKGDLALVKQCIEEGMPVDATDGNGRTALIEAAWSGFEAVVDFLIDQGAVLDGRDSSGFTALMRAVDEGFVSIVKKLIGHGANVNTHGKVRGSTPLMLAAELGDVECIHLLVDNGAKINAVDLFEETALARAYRTEQLVSVYALEARGATRRPERGVLTLGEGERRPLTKATVPQWSAAADDAGFIDDAVGDGFEEEESV